MQRSPFSSKNDGTTSEKTAGVLLNIERAYLFLHAPRRNSNSFAANRLEIVALLEDLHSFWPLSSSRCGASLSKGSSGIMLVPFARSSAVGAEENRVGGRGFGTRHRLLGYQNQQQKQQQLGQRRRWRTDREVVMVVSKKNSAFFSLCDKTPRLIHHYKSDIK